EGRYNGIGGASEKIGDFLTIVELYEDQPADKAGLKVGDKILAIDGKDAAGKDVEALNNILRGFPGTEVELLIRRPGEKKDFPVTVVREELEVKNVPYYGMVSDDIGYFALTTFTRQAGANVASALKSLQTENANLKGVIFDLRGNGGGLLTEAVNVSNVFIPKNELVVTTKGKVNDWNRSFNTLGTSVDEEIPLVVLIDGKSASASEIVSGVVQDYDRGILLGQRSYGKGLVQNTRDIGYNSKVKLTTAKYYIPSGRCIQAVEYEDGEPVDIPVEKRTAFKTSNGRTVYDGGGVKPDVVVDLDGNSNILKMLEKHHIIFDYVTEYCKNKETVAEVENLRYTDFNDFLAYVNRRNFDYDTDTESLLKELEEKSSTDGFELSGELAAVRNKIITTKRSEVQKYKDAIVDMIEKEMAGRYYYQEGKVRIGLRNDREIQDAIQLLKNPTEYQRILSN
ncbi:MAG: S41 family peptidase, partial [Bacteroidota bacterium]